MSGTLHPLDRRIAREIRRQRQARGLGLEALAMRAGLTRQQLQRLETGGARLTPARLYLIAEALELPVAIFFEGGGDVAGMRPLHDAARRLRPELRRELARVIAELAGEGRG